MAPSVKKNASPVLRLSLLVILGSALLGAIIFSAQSFEQFLIRDPRFLIAPPPDYGEDSPSLTVEGVQYASRTKVMEVFNPDFGRSLYLLPLEQRRAALLRLSWVRDASVRRIWPSRVDVRITERQPAAFIPVAFGPMSRYALIDSDGVILDPPAKAQFNLPVLKGIEKADSESQRGQRVRRMQRMLRELGNLGSGISEVDTGDLDNLKVRLMLKNQSFLLILGDSGFASRMENFFNHYQEIHNRIPWATTLDLRLEDRITAVGEAPSVQ